MAVHKTDMIKRAPRLSTYLRRLVNSVNHPSSRCALCLAPARPERLCPDCEGDLPVLFCACAICAAPLPFGDQACGRCQKQRPAFDRAQAAFIYDYPVKPMIGRFKYQGERVMAWPLIQHLIDRLEDRDFPRPDVIVPCPIHSRRYRSRGFNQAAVIAWKLGEGLGIPVDYRLCSRPRAMPSQTGLDRAARLKNLKDAFLIHGKPPPRVAIVDDVITTGATAEQLAKAFKAAGAKDVSVWALARTPLL